MILSEESADVCGHTAGDVYFANLDFIDCEYLFVEQLMLCLPVTSSFAILPLHVNLL